MLGASFDTVDENKAFADAEHFNYRLLSDPDRSAGAAYEAVRDPDADFSDFAKRVAYLIDPDGVIRQSYEVKDTEGFAAQVLADLEAARS